MYAMLKHVINSLDILPKFGMTTRKRIFAMCFS